MNPDDVTSAFINELNLSSVGKNQFIGHVNEVPFRIEMVVNAHTLGLLFHTRFSKTLKALPEYPPAQSGGLLEELIAEKEAELSTDEKGQAWFNLFAAHKLVEAGTLLEAVKELAGTLKEYVDFREQDCFTCRAQKETTPVFHSENFYLVCDDCMGLLNKRAEVLQKIDGGNLAYSLIWAVIVSVVGGLVWCAGWLAFNWMMGGMTLPQIVFVVSYLALGAAVGFPIGFILKKIPRRGDRLAGAITVFACLLTAFLGEAFFSAYYFIKIMHEPPNAQAILVVWKIFMSEAGHFYFVGKVITFGIMCALALNWAKSKVSLENEIARAKGVK